MFWSSDPPNLVQDEPSCIFTPHYLKKERSCRLVDARFEFYTKNYSLIWIFRVMGGSITNLWPSQHHHSHRTAFLMATPLNFRSLLRENDRDYDAQNFRIFISHHYLPSHLKRKKSMTCCGAHPRCWHGIALYIWVAHINVLVAVPYLSQFYLWWVKTHLSLACLYHFTINKNNNNKNPLIWYCSK